MSEPEIAADAIAETPATEIPDKLYFRIGEVARLVGIKPYVLRFWETEFPSLGPRKSGTGHRLYRRKDVEQALEIKRLLYEKRYTIEGARKFLDARVKSEAPPAPGGKGKGRARAGGVKGTAGAVAAAAAQPGQAGLFDAPSPAVLDMLRKELTAIVDMLK
jgi:DNA-binding transcriptional MerR regulator